MTLPRYFAVLLLALLSMPAFAHDLPVAYVGLQEHAGGEVAVTTKAARRGALLPRPISLDLDAACKRRGVASIETTPETVIRQWQLRCEQPLTGARLRLSGLDAIRPNAIVRLRLADGSESYLHADRYNTELVLSTDANKSPKQGLSAYFGLGVTHILTGIDHLLFVLGLILVIWRGGYGLRALLATITAFTLAHSFTLALATLSKFSLPGTAVEACIAASILLLAVELARFERRRAQGQAVSLTFRQPWLVAFAFGLLHGFGFAGALAETGLPEGARVWALLFFNLGVEAGQLLFIAGVGCCYFMLRTSLPVARAAALATTLIGAVASFWLIERFTVIIGI